MAGRPSLGGRLAVERAAPDRLLQDVHVEDELAHLQATRNVVLLGFFTPETTREYMQQGLSDGVDLLLSVASGHAAEIRFVGSEPHGDSYVFQGKAGRAAEADGA